MKKSILLIFVLALSVLLPKMVMADAKVCQISGTLDTVEIFSDYYDAPKEKLIVNLSSDSQQAANVKITVEVTYKNDIYNKKKTKTYTQPFRAEPAQSTVCEMLIPKSFKVDGYIYEYESYKITGLTGTKCQTNQ